ncbi:hypothetical protein [uncultured Candidatus Kuenenia sp.]|uniref:hypothetical protein n=1 Tax=uncultured Candidatus Kuenenia sp. TaxID=1048336 RepID=UPI0002D5CB69|nr:hypothetical protein [uncultured Candidatus Kuenenia sp.]
MTIFDTDILSTFAKINRLDLIKKLFGTIYITPMIKEELLAPLEYGYKFPLQILNDSTVIMPTEGDLRLYANLSILSKFHGKCCLLDSKTRINTGFR